MAGYNYVFSWYNTENVPNEDAHVPRASHAYIKTHISSVKINKTHIYLTFVPAFHDRSFVTRKVYCWPWPKTKKRSIVDNQNKWLFFTPSLYDYFLLPHFPRSARVDTGRDIKKIRTHGYLQVIPVTGWVWGKILPHG